jgi:predicted phosphohydrolase
MTTVSTGGARNVPQREQGSVTRPACYHLRVPTLVAMADTHGYHKKLKVPDGDILIHAGDLTEMGTLEQLTEVRDWLLSLPHAHKVVIAGNHDFGLQDDAERCRALFGPPLIYLEDQLATVAGLRIWGSPWQPWFHSWAFNLPRGPEIAAKWALIPTGVDVLVTHGPPAGYGDLCFHGERVGCEDLLRELDRVKPRLHLFGHIHEDKGTWQLGPTTIVNVTTAECSAPCWLGDLPLSRG